MFLNFTLKYDGGKMKADVDMNQNVTLFYVDEWYL